MKHVTLGKAAGYVCSEQIIL